MSIIIGHRGFSAKYLENSLEACRQALSSGMQGFEVDVQPTLDGVCMVLHDDDLVRTAQAGGVLRQLKSNQLPLLKNGESVPRLMDLLELPASLINVELKGEPGWKQALAAVEGANALNKVIFSSFEHSEVLQLWAQCPEARCGFLWEEEEANELEENTLASLPTALTFHVPLASVVVRPHVWKPFSHKLALWGLKHPKDIGDLDFEPAILIVDGV